jgi:N-acetyl-anhydromuramyl-L-alanine amidase AmpD
VFQRLTKKQKRRIKAYIRVYAARFVALCIVIALFLGGFLLVRTIVRKVTGDEKAMETVLDVKLAKKVKRVYERPELDVQLLPPNPNSRPGDNLPEVNAVFVHYTANPGTDAAQNRSYFANLAQTKETSASAHFIIGYEGEIIQCVPLWEIAYAVKGRNYDSVSIECCYLNENGEFTQETYDSLIRLTAWLLGKYELDTDAVKRHYDEGGKNCPKFYVENEEQWKNLVQDIGQYIEDNGTYEKPETDEEVK